MELQPKSALILRTRLFLALLFGTLIGAALAAFSPGSFWLGWLAASLLLVPALMAMLVIWNWAGGGRVLAWMMILAFSLRLVAGVGFSLALPHWGYPRPEQQAGYLFKDAYNRDRQAWSLAQSNNPLYASFREEFSTDQYGGLLALSALIYRYLSPDAHRPFLILILGAFTVAFGLPFLWRAARLHWPSRVAVLAGWIYVFYPDSIFFASAQMREPFLMGLVVASLWAVLAWNWRSALSWLVLFGSLLIMAVISSRVAAAAAGFLGLLFLLEYVVKRQDRRWKIAGWIGLVVGVLLLLSFSWEWFRYSTVWDVSLTHTNSGWVRKLVTEASEMTGLAPNQIQMPVVVAYGLARPVLPAAIAEPAESALWKVIVIFRSIGWYALVPFLIYSIFAVWKERDPDKRRRVIWLVLAVVLWLLIASARGGGDATDNPRYRILFIPWMALLAAWAVDWALTHRDAWLWRWILIEAIFLGFFTNWYFSRYFLLWGRLPFWHMTAWILGLSALVLIGGWVWDRWSRARAGA
jgi:hypothetical protein